MSFWLAGLLLMQILVEVNNVAHPLHGKRFSNYHFDVAYNSVAILFFFWQGFELRFNRSGHRDKARIS